MEDAGTCSYSKLKKREKGGSRAQDFAEVNISVSNLNISPPKDVYNIIYISFVLGGAGFLFPYNSFIMAIDYFKVRYPGTPVVFDMSLVYIVTAFITVLGNNLLVETFSLTARINFGYIMSFLTLIFVVTCEVSWEAFKATSYTVNLGAVAVVAIGCTVQQSSFYGYTSMLPSRYTQAVMVGESVSGVFTSGVRVLTKFAVSEIKGSTVYFFAISILSVGTCFITYHINRKSDFIQFYMALHERAKTKIVLEPTEDVGLMDSNDLQYGMLKIQNSPPPANTCIGFSNPVYEPSGQAPTFKVEDVVIKGRTASTSVSGLSDIKRGLQARLTITKAIYPYMISICMVYFVTLCLYPGIISEIISCKLGSWMPIIMMAIFNGADLLGKILASSSWNWNGPKLVKWSFFRLFILPLMLICAVPKGDPYCSTEVFAFILSLILGITNGILGSVPMIHAAGQVEDCNRELTGNMMTLLYNFGLISGALMSYLLETRIPPFDPTICGYTMLTTESSATVLPANLTTFESTTRFMDNLTAVFSTTDSTTNALDYTLV